MGELYKGFPWMKDILQPGKSPSERFELVRFELSKETVEFEKMSHLFGGKYYEVYGLIPGTYMKLIDRTMNVLWMSDTWMERDSSIDPKSVKGKVFVGGLGMGMQLKGFETNLEITKVVVVEKEKELVEWIWPQLNLDSRFSIEIADVFEYQPKEKFDLIFLDIWSGISEDNLPEMRKLSYKYRKYVNKAENPNARIEYWRRESCRQIKRENGRW